MVAIGLGDDQAKYGHLTAFYPWWNSLLIELKKNLVAAKESLSTELYSYRIERVPIDPSSQNSPFDRFSVCLSLFAQHKSSSRHGRLLSARLVENRRLTSSDWFQDVRNLCFCLTGQDARLEYELCDIAAVYPTSPAEIVQRAVAVLAIPQGLQMSSWIRVHNISSIKRSSRLSSLSNLLTIRDLCTHVLDISGIPQRSFFEGIAPFATNGEEKEKLMELASAEGMDVFYDYVVREKRNYVEILEDFRSCRPPLERLLELIPVIQPRQYSIASYLPWQSQQWQDGQVYFDICVSRSQTRTRHGRLKRGLCSNYLCNLEVGETIHLYIQPSVLSSKDISKPLIMIGPGTGLAPMRALLQRHLLSYRQDRQSTPPCLLFCGFRKKSHDFLYDYEWNDIFDHKKTCDDDDFFHIKDDDGLRDQVVYDKICMSVAFSRDGDESFPKTYVMNKLTMHGFYLWKLIQEQGGRVLISGSATKMPRDVRKAIVNIFQQYGGLTKDEAETYVVQLERSKRYIVEAWS
jgi:sulfite reductase alpha subunit-like flavoprotein